MDDRVLLDADIREPLFDYLEQHHGKVRFLEEKVTGKARADVVMVLPDKICGIEIAAEHVPAYWGIISVELIKGEIDFYRVRDAKPNPKAKLKNKMSLLWKSEFSHILAENKMPKYAQKSKKFISEKLLNKVPEEVLHEQISEELFERDYTIYD